MDKVPKKNTVSANFSHALFSFGFLDPWSWNWYVVPKHQCRIITLCRVISQKNADLTRYHDTGLGLALYGPVQNIPMWHSRGQCFLREFKITSHI